MFDLSLHIYRLLHFLHSKKYTAFLELQFNGTFLIFVYCYWAENTFICNKLANLTVSFSTWLTKALLRKGNEAPILNYPYTYISVYICIYMLYNVIYNIYTYIHRHVFRPSLYVYTLYIKEPFLCCSSHIFKSFSKASISAFKTCLSETHGEFVAPL